MPVAENKPVKPEAEVPLLDLRTAVELEDFWAATRRLLSTVIPHHSCSLMLGIVDYQPLEGRHHVADKAGSASRPVNSLSIAKPFLAAHPRRKLYTYGDILKEDPNARHRRREREKLFSGWDQFVHLAFWDGDQPDAVLSVRRTAEQGDFSAEEREFLALLHPTLDAGLRRLRRTHRERERGTRIECFLRGLPVPVVFVEHGGRIRLATREGREFCSAWVAGERTARAVRLGRSPSLPPDIAAACAQLAADPDGSPARGRAGIRVRHPSIRGFYAQVDQAQAVAGPWGRPGYWVTFSRNSGEDGGEPAAGPHAWALMRRLSPSERHVARLVARGQSNREVATELGKSLRTVEFQLNAIYRKLDVRGRTQLARILARG